MSDPSDVARVVVEELAIVIDLRVGWEIAFDDEARRLTAVGSDSPWHDRDMCPSITVRSTPFSEDSEEFERLATESLDVMP
jgi:hypothetical protein